jgi:RNA polymerase sigma factor (sigma-70 family)
MATTVLGTVLCNVRRSLLFQEEAGHTDRDLLERFVSEHDEAAFEALLCRHGPMVLGTCRRVLRNEADAADAFQATFLVLIRKAGSIRQRGMVSNWLYGVAHNIARKTRGMSIKRLEKEREAAEQPRPETAEPSDRLLALLDEELGALPEKYRAAIVLCDLEGKSIKEAARQLGSPPGTIGTRLARGRSMLAQRLARRGLTLSGGALATELARNAAMARVPLPLLTSTIRAASRFAAGQAAIGVVGARAAALIEGALRTMLLNKLKVTAAVLLLLTVVGLGTSLLAGQEPPPDALPQKPGAKETKEMDKDGERLARFWRGVSAQVDGITYHGTDPGEPAPYYWTLTEDAGCFDAKWVRPDNSPNELAFKFTYKIDTTVKPCTIDLFPEEGPAKGKMLRGIYSVGWDKFTICYVSPNIPEPDKKQRPSEFAARKDSGYVLLVFREGDGLYRGWEGVSAEVDGASVPAPAFWGFGRASGGSDKRHGPKFTPNEVDFRFTFKLDASAKPKAIDLIPEKGPAKGKTLHGIYSLEGDKLEICYVSPSTPEPEKKERPGAFAARKGSGCVSLVFRKNELDVAVFDKAELDKAEREYARGVVAAWNEAGYWRGSKEDKEIWATQMMDSRIRRNWLDDSALRLASFGLLPGTVINPVEGRLAGRPAPALEGLAWHNTAKPLGWQDLQGKVVVLDFMARSCVGCLEDLPRLNALHKQFGNKGLVVICVLAGKDQEGAAEEAKMVPEFLKKHAIAFPVLVDTGKTFERYDIEAYHTYLVVDKAGKVVSRGGRLPYAAPPTAEEIKELLAR